jgi:hypothetical protein
MGVSYAAYPLLRCRLAISRSASTACSVGTIQPTIKRLKTSE